MNWVKKGMVTFSLAMAKTEKDTFAQNGSEDLLRNNSGIVTPHVTNQLMSDLKEGRLTQQVKQFRKQHYEILRESSKFKFKDGELMTEQEVRQSKITQGDPFDSYPVEVVFDNKAIGHSLFESSTVRPLKIQRGVISRNKIENHTSTLHVRTVEGNNKLLDFYIPKSNENKSIVTELEHLKRTGKMNEFVNFTKTVFTTQDTEMLVFEYKMLAFDRVVEYNNNYIVKMFAECTVDGRWKAEWTQIID